MYASINGTDISKYIEKSSYSVNSEDVYGRSWQDANGTFHNDVLRKRITGSFVVGFWGSGTERTAFLQLAKNATANGIITITVYVSNTGETKTIQAFCKMVSQKHLENESFNTSVDKIEIQLEER